MIEIISGGQTGADRAALDFAIEHGFPHGGWCPRGRRAEDGRIDDCYELRETPSHRYAERTERNVCDSDATVVFSIARQLCGGSALTIATAKRLRKPLLQVARDEYGIDEAAALLRAFVETHGIRKLNIAGPRASQEPNVGAYVHKVLRLALLQEA